MVDETFVVTGRVIDTKRDRGVPDLRIEAWDADQRHDDFTGRATTDADGRFRIAIEQSYFEDLFGERRPDLYFKIFHRDELIHDTEDSVLWEVEADETNVVIEIEGVQTHQDILFEFEPDITVDVYAEPDDDAEVIDQLSPDVKRAVSRAEDGWYLVRTRQGQEGWIAHDDVPVLRRAIQEFLAITGNPVLDEQKLDIIYDTIDALFDDEADQAAYSKRVDRLRREAAILNVLAQDAHAYLRGDPNAENRLLTTLETAIDPLPIATGSKRPTAGSLGGTPTSPPPGIPDIPGQVPCLVNPRSFAAVQAALVRLAQSADSPGGPRVESIYRNYASTIDLPLQSMRQLELLYSEARIAATGQRRSRERFEAVLNAVGGDEPFSEDLPAAETDRHEWSAITAGSPTGPGIDFEIQPDVINFCLEQQLRDSARAVECLCKGSYEVHEITNLSQERPDGEPYDATGCAGDVVAIEGEGFGDTRDWGYVGRKSQVIFGGNEESYSDGTTGVPVADGDYEEWSDTRVEVRVPEEAESGRISMRILCEDLDVSKCGVQLKPPTGDHRNRYFEVPDPPVVEEFNIRTPDRGVIRGSEPMVDACKPVTFLLEVRNAEEVTVVDEDGREVEFPAGSEGERRSIEGETTPVSRPESETYRLRARNLCHTVEEEIHLIRRVGIVVDTEPSVVTAGESFEFVVTHTCAPEVLGFDQTVVEVEAADPYGVLHGAPDTVRFEAEETEKSFTIDTASGACTSLTITANVVEEHETYDRPHTEETYHRLRSEVTVDVVGTPEITNVRTTGPNACDSFTFEIDGNCFSQHFRGRRSDMLNRVVLKADGARQVLDPTAMSGPRIKDLSFGADPPWEGMTLVCESGPRLGDHDFDVTVSHHGETSNSVSLTDGPLEYPRPQILTFRPDPPEIPGGGPTEITLNYTVEYVERVEIRSLGGPRLKPDGVIFAEFYDTCDTINWSTTHKTWWEHTFELRAYPLDSGPPVGEEVTVTIRGEKPSATGPCVQKFEIVNCERERHTIHVYLYDYNTREGWQYIGNLEAAHDSSGRCPPPRAESVMVPSESSPFEDGHVYEIRIVDPAEENEAFDHLDPCTGGPRGDPNDANCVTHYIGPFCGDPDGVLLTGTDAFVVRD